MNCPYCNSIISDYSGRCKCGAELGILKKAYRLSNAYYNRGLSKARVHDLSGAISDLKKSLKLNKHNTPARNLLGLVYYEIGEVVDALSEWVLSKHFQPEDNEMAEGYLDDIQASPAKIDNFNQSYKKYNLALQAAKQDNDDLAIIHLKKVIALNTHFLKAMQLLALEYIKIDEPDKAKKLLKRAKRMDISNNITLTYLDEVTISEENRESDTSGIDDKTFNFPISTISYREEKPNIMQYLNLIIGIVVGICVTAFLIVPHVEKKAAKEYNVESIGNSDELSANELEIKNIKNENESLQSKIDNLNKDLENMQTQMGGIECYNNLLSASSLFLSGDKEGAAVALSNVDASLFASQDANVLYEYLKGQVYAEVVSKLANEGKNLCNSGKLQEALVPLLKAYQMTSDDDAVLYFLGRSYQKLNDLENAKKYYQELITKLPTTTRAYTARKRMKEMGFEVEEPVVTDSPNPTQTPSDTGTQTDTGTEPGTDTQSGADTQTGTGTEPQTDTEPEAGTQPQAGTEPEAGTQPEVGAEPEAGA